MVVLGLHCFGGLSLVTASRGYSLRSTNFSLQWLLLLQSKGSRHAGLATADHGLSCPKARGILQEQGWTCVRCTGRWILTH